MNATKEQERIEKAKMIKEGLGQFYGTSQWYKSMLGLIYTDGVKYLADMAGAYWLIDVIASYRRREPFQVWTMKVNHAPENGDPMAVVTMREDTNEPVRVRQYIEKTDFPLEEIELWVEGGVLLLPSEH